MLQINTAKPNLLNRTAKLNLPNSSAKQNLLYQTAKPNLPNPSLKQIVRYQTAKPNMPNQYPNTKLPNSLFHIVKAKQKPELLNEI